MLSGEICAYQVDGNRRHGRDTQTIGMTNPAIIEYRDFQKHHGDEQYGKEAGK
jgi:hypothetical protein